MRRPARRYVRRTGWAATRVLKCKSGMPTTNDHHAGQEGSRGCCAEEGDAAQGAPGKSGMSGPVTSGPANAFPRACVRAHVRVCTRSCVGACVGICVRMRAVRIHRAHGCTAHVQGAGLRGCGVAGLRGCGVAELRGCGMRYPRCVPQVSHTCPDLPPAIHDSLSLAARPFSTTFRRMPTANAED